MDWAQAQTGLGTALQWTGIQEDGLDRLREAEAAERAALEVYSEAETPLDWAYVSDDLGWTLRFTASAAARAKTLVEAQALLQRAWDIYKASGQNLDRYFGKRLAEIEALLS